MRKSLSSVALTLLTTVAIGASIPVKDNSELAVTLATNNYNRLVVKNDKIVEAVFPPNSMAIRRDEQDGSVYVMLSAAHPFTLFLTTEAGRHFSVTLTGEEALGKTIELIPEQSKPTIVRGNFTAKSNPKTMSHAAIPEAILAMLTHMEQQKPFADVKVKRQWGHVERWSKGLTLVPRESWQGNLLKGEAIELYNGGKAALTLSEDWFVKAETLAVKVSKANLNPGEHAMLYRVQGASHG
ncbi:type-F conjugative transfer system secretin TraK [Legionella gresilensis]|uniref:type-F conjugative transfer system secretin TraK n=1 Tax=Legionella gresilensis TaxID=91823 RepID=UPI001041705A|nr:type-F conjugative transfer system secretin TraK [Legionella gresilensis]